ncbi:hypothetical protein [Gemmatimonas sp.]|uniref:hypothetical protein n=1 Tax=Gemmatimonas sp. TaxID=1962908 RepID=UPI0031BD0528|nr:hypothetical protein [Gemmatimonas sp.]
MSTGAVPVPFNQEEVISAFHTRLRAAAVPLLTPIAFGVLTACGGSDCQIDEPLRADLTAASQSPANRQPFMNPAEMDYPQRYAPGYQQGDAPYPGQYPQPYPQPYPPQAYPAPHSQQAQTRGVYVPQSGAVRRSGSVGGGSGVVCQERRNTQKGAGIGALGGAVLGWLIGHQVNTP